ncbi:MAG: 6-hydroxymethylpterin diphosphokinase MptE-like protein [Candidatus Hodarchaeales archaeon]|jgi:uncharacterized Rossmann fold enzyme
MKDEYSKIVEKLNLSVSEDISSSKNLEFLLKAIGSVNSSEIFQNLSLFLKSPCLIAGGGPSIERDLERCIELDLLEKLTIIAVDGTCKLFHEIRSIPNILVTDLDGDWSSIYWAIKNETITLIHAHGDNHHLIDDFFLEYEDIRHQRNIWGTTQNYISSDLFNFGGFTDGDRAIFLAFHFQTPVIGIIGFDFGNEIGKYSLSHPSIVKDLSRKKLKFKIALGLLKQFHQYHKGLRINLTGRGVEIPGFPRSTIASFADIINKDYTKHNNEEFPK